MSYGIMTSLVIRDRRCRSRQSERGRQPRRPSNLAPRDADQCETSPPSPVTSCVTSVCESVFPRNACATSRLSEVTEFENSEMRLSNTVASPVSMETDGDSPRLLRNAAAVRRGRRSSCHLWVTAAVVLVALVAPVRANVPPRFVLDGQSEIVLRLREGDRTPVGSVIYRLRGYDADGDRLQFAVRGQVGSRLLEIRPDTDTEADLVLKRPLDRELEDEYSLVLTLTDGRLGQAVVTQSLLILVEDVNDNRPMFLPYEPTITVPEDSGPRVLAVLQATDRDEGPFGQVVYRLETDSAAAPGLFSVTTRDGQAVLSLRGKLDYERQPFYQLQVLASDRAATQAHTATAAVVVRVGDVADRPPEFVVVPPVTRIPEDLPVGSQVMKVLAIDGDRAVNEPIEYALFGGDAIFSIAADSGAIYVSGRLDRERRIETNGAYILTIGAREAGSGASHVTTEATVILTDVNDETPTFRSATYTAEVSEAAQRHLPLTLLGSAAPQVFDYDQGTNGTFRMYLEGDGGLFEVTPPEGVNEATFMIRVRDPAGLDYETVREMNFSVVAEEVTEVGGKSSRALVTLYIRDANDNLPEFAEKRYQVSVAENVRRGAVIGWLQALDADSGAFGTDGIRYTDITGDIAQFLHLDPETGQVTVVTDDHGLDREAAVRHQLTVEARDDNGRGNRNRVPLEVIVLDVNDRPPRCLRSPLRLTVTENDPRLSPPARVEATDDDQPGTANSELSFRIVAGNAGGNFSIDGSTGRLGLVRALDFEALYGEGDTRTVNLTVQVSDRGEPPLSSLCLVQVAVRDENDEAPQFDRAVYSRTVSEDAPGTTRVIQVSARDGDGSSQNSRVVYRIQHGAQDKFVINSTTGVITVAEGANLDPDLSRPRAENYKLTVAALDGGLGADQLVDVATVNITIQDVNNKLPSFTEPGLVTIPEDVPLGTVVRRVVATDLDAVPLLRYSIDGSLGEARTEEGTLVRATDYNYTAAFQIHPIEGVIRTVRTLDRERVETIRLVLRVEDLAAMNSRQTATATLTVRLADVNDHAPIFRQPYYARAVMENSKPGTPIVSVVAEDRDLDRTIQYSLHGPPEIVDLVFLDVETGEIVVGKRIDREQTTWLNFTVKATDSGRPTRAANADVYVQVLDENDNNPQFVDSESVVTLREDVPIGTVVVQVEARDVDSGDYGQLTYRLDRRSSEGKFQIDADTGAVTVLAELDREQRSEYTLIIEAWDNYQFGFTAGQSRNAFKQIRVEISDVNDETPVLHLPSACVTVTEFHDPRDVISLVTADDADDVTTPNGRVRFSVAAGNEDGLFTMRAIDANSANLLATRRLVGYYGNYSLTVVAEDGGYPPNMARGQLTVCIADFNDHAPRFTQPPANISIRIPEDAPLGSPIISVHAEDADVGINGAVRYRLRPDLLGNHHTFQINDVTGQILLRKPLDRERQKVYEIRVEAYDLGVPTALSSDLDLTVFVRDVNDFQPQFLVDSFSVNFTEHLAPGEQRRRLVQTVDRDEPDEDQLARAPPVCYFIVAGNQDGCFTLDSQKHDIMAIKELDREVKSEYTLIVKATEDCQKRPPEQAFFKPDDDTLLKVIVYVDDINDNQPKFVRPLFTGGVTTESDYGAEVITVQAIDLDSEENAQLRYSIKGEVQKTLSEGLETIGDVPFMLDPKTGIVMLNFDPQKGMKGYFDFVVSVKDRSGLGDEARVFIYLLREDQRVKFVLRMQPQETRLKIDYLRDYLGNVSDSIVNVDEFKVHETSSGTVDRTKTDLYLHFVDRRDHSILEVDRALALLDQNVETLDPLFKEFNVLSTRAAAASSAREEPAQAALGWLLGACCFLLLLLATVLGACLSQRAKYRRQLRAATATAFGSPTATVSRTSAVPNTNVHAVEGSNPVWMGAFENNCYKLDTSDAQPCSSRLYVEGDSLDENALTDSLTLSAQQQQELFTSQHSRRSSARSSVNFNTPDTVHKTTNDLGRYQKNLLSQSSRLWLEHTDTQTPRGKHVETTEL